jgi:hypothetical protein
MELFLPSGESVQSPAIKIALSVRPSLEGASLISDLKMTNNPVSNTILLFEYQSKEKCSEIKQP